jgi:hypothetical protein
LFVENTLRLAQEKLSELRVNIDKMKLAAASAAPVHMALSNKSSFSAGKGETFEALWTQVLKCHGETDDLCKEAQMIFDEIGFSNWYEFITLSETVLLAVLREKFHIKTALSMLRVYAKNKK